MNQYRTGGAQIVIPGYGVEVVQPMVGGVAVGEAWYTAGGAPAPLAAYQPIGAASLAASYVNLATPGTYDAAPVVAPTWAAATGWTFDGTQYLDSGIVPTTGWSMVVRFNNVTNTGFLCGSQNSSGNRFFLNPTISSKKTYGAGGQLAVVPIQPEGTLAIAGNNCYANGADVGATTGGISNTFPVFIGARNFNGGPLSYIAANIQALAIYDTTLDATMVAAVHAAMLAL